MVIISSVTLAQSPTTNSTAPATETKKWNITAGGMFWWRYTELNPGSKINNKGVNSHSDLLIRRVRVVATGEISENWKLYSIIGLNNLNSLSNEAQLMLMDLASEYTFDEKLIFGLGKNGYTGPSRYASPSALSFLGLDVSIMALSTVNITDDAVRKYSTYLKGDLGKLNYRMIIARPNRLKKAEIWASEASFSAKDPELQYSGYFKYQFRDKESNASPYHTFSYFGKKNFINLGAGFEYQKNATHSLSGTDSLYHPLLQATTDLFIDVPINHKLASGLTFYFGYFYSDYGPNYLRNIGINNPAAGSSNLTINGQGNAFPIQGTGSTFYTQIALHKDISESGFKIKGIQPYILAQNSYFERLDHPMFFFEIGTQILFKGNHSKWVMGIQNWPVFINNNDIYEVSERNNMMVMAYQFIL